MMFIAAAIDYYIPLRICTFYTLPFPALLHVQYNDFRSEERYASQTISLIKQTMGNCQNLIHEKARKETLKVKQTYKVLLPESAGLKVFPPTLLKSANAFLVTLVYFSGKETQFLSLT